MTALRQFVMDDRGVDLIEYALLAGLIGVVAVASLQGIGDSVKKIYGFLNTEIAKAAPATP